MWRHTIVTSRMPALNWRAMCHSSLNGQGPCHLFFLLHAAVFVRCSPQRNSRIYSSTDDWRADVGLCLPFCGTEVVYDSPKVCDEELSLPSPSPATKKGEHEQFENDVDEITTDSDIAGMGQEGKTLEELDPSTIATSREQAFCHRAMQNNAYSCRNRLVCSHPPLHRCW